MKLLLLLVVVVVAVVVAVVLVAGRYDCQQSVMTSVTRCRPNGT